jgi:heme/copper-type cytochrome/quinol oxidase subunit 1
VDDVVMPVLVAAVLTMSAAQLFDLATFVTMVNRVGPGAEANPLVGLLFGLYGYPMVAIVKVVLVAVVSAVAALLVGTPVRPRLAATVLIVAIVVGLAGGLSNSIALGAI